MKLEKKHWEAIYFITKLVIYPCIFILVYALSDEIEKGYLNTDIQLFNMKIKTWQPYLSIAAAIVIIAFYILRNGFKMKSSEDWWFVIFSVVFSFFAFPSFTKSTLLAINKTDTSRTIVREVKENKISEANYEMNYDGTKVNRIDLPFEMEIQKDKNQVVSYLGLLDIPVYYRWKE